MKRGHLSFSLSLEFDKAVQPRYDKEWEKSRPSADVCEFVQRLGHGQVSGLSFKEHGRQKCLERNNIGRVQGFSCSFYGYLIDQLG